MTPEQTAAFDHRIVHERAPSNWHEGFPLGNGELGVMAWGDGDPLAFTLDKSDLWDLRCNNDYMTHPDFNYAGLRRLVEEGRFSDVDEVFEGRGRRDNPIGPTKISIGRAEFRLGEGGGYECRLDLGTATVDGVVRTDAGEHQVQAFVHREQNVFCLRVTPCPSDARMVVVPLREMNESLATLDHPRPQVEEEGDLRMLVQKIPEGTCYAVLWNLSGPEIFLVVESGVSPEEARTRARATWQRAADAGFERLYEEHTEGWRAFWAGSAVYLPERRMEFLWYYGLYLLASSTRRGSIPPGLQGVWPMDGVLPPWRGDYHADMNVQEIFWPACASGHLDLLDSWCDLMRDCLEPAQAFTRRFFGTEGTFWTCAFLPRYTWVPGWHTVQFAWSHSGWLGWMLWLRWRYSMDLDWLAETGYPLLAEIFRFYRANLAKEEDGHLHVPVSTSPEYRENSPAAWCKDPNMDLALIRRCCDWVEEMEAALGRDDLSASAQEVRENLVPYHLTDGQVLCLWADKPLDESHRHPSHLMAIHPAMDLTVDDGEDVRRIVDASLEQYFSLGQYHWAGHTYAQMASFAAVVDRPEFAYDCLLHFAEYWMGPNGLHFNRDLRMTGITLYRAESGPFTMEANCGVAAGIGDMLVQGWHDLVRVFPAVPAHWRDVAFRDLLTEGAFRVSAVRRDGRTVWVKVRAGVERTLRLRDPFGSEPMEVSGGTVSREGEVLSTDLERGQEIVLCRQGESMTFDEAVARTRTSDISRVGLR